MSDLEPLIADVLPQVRQLRRDLHTRPELGFEEVTTARKVTAILEKLPGFTLLTGVASTGIVATLGADLPGPCVALRADMDALPITEETGVDYASTRPGCMHACGHDGHTAALVGAAMVLARRREELQGPVRFLFQPAEEGGGGASRMIAEGALEHPRVDAVFGAHNWPSSDLAVGDLALRAGPFMGGSVDFRIVIHGQGGHAATPHRALDPIFVGAQVVNSVQAIVSREANPLESLVITFGRFHAGSAVNSIPETAVLEGTLRSLSPELLETAPARLKSMVEGIAAAHRARAEVSVTPGYPVTSNHADAAAYVVQTARTAASMARVRTDYEPTLCAEDFSFYQRERPAAFYFLGARPADRSTVPFLHHPKFNYNDDLLPSAIAMHCELARNFAREWGRHD